MTNQTRQAVKPAKPNKPHTELIFSPSESASAFVRYAEQIRAAPGITWGVASLDRDMVPIRPGEVVGIIARPGHGKSTLAAYLAKREARRIAAAGKSDECVIYVSFEQAVEEIEALLEVNGETFNASDVAWGRANIDAVKTMATARITLPIWFIGRGMERPARSRMTINAVYDAIASMRDDYGVHPTLVVIDYIQIVPVEGAVTERAAQVGEAIVRAKELALSLKCAMVLCVQAGRDVDKRERKIPDAGDCQWASAIEQVADKLFGIWRPSKTEDEAETVEIGSRTLAITPNLLIVKMVKQRMEDAGRTYALHFAPQWIRLADIEDSHGF